MECTTMRRPREGAYPHQHFLSAQHFFRRANRWSRVTTRHPQPRPPRMHSTHCPIVFPAAHCPTRVRAHRLLFTRTAPTYSIFKTRAPVKRTPNLLTYSSISTRCPTCQSFREPVPQKRISRLSVGSSRYTGVRHPFVDVSDRKTKV
jgi:hypothetical protein